MYAMAIHAYIMERGDPAGLLHLAGRLLADAALGHEARILLRLQGARWLLPPALWPPIDPAGDAWLRAQEYSDLATFWADARSAAMPSLAVCAGSRRIFDLAPDAEVADDSLIGFLAAAEADGAEIHWLA